MKYEVNMNDWSLDLEIKVECDDFELISEIQMAIDSVVESFTEAKNEAENEVEEDEDDAFETDLDEDESDDVEIEGSQGTIIIINNK
jgi:hypothetical protein